MDRSNHRTLNLSLDAEADFLPVVMQFVEKSALAFGMGKEESLQLCLAAEEIYLYLCDAVCPGRGLDIQCRNGVYYTRLFFRFDAAELNLSGLNITSAVTHDDDATLAEMGLLIAARSVDHLNIFPDRRGRICLVATKHKSYPGFEEPVPPPEDSAAVSIETPDVEGVKRFALQVAQCCAGPFLPPFFAYPGKVADMVAGGEYEALIALNHKRDIAGGILFYNRTEKIVQCFGPFAFTGDTKDDVAGMLLDACVARIARTKSLGLLNVSGLPVALQPRFEKLGSLTYYGKDGRALKLDYLYRHLHEDPVCEVWMHRDIEEFLRREYERLFLARQMRAVQAMGESRAGSSIISAEIQSDRSVAMLRPLWSGADFEQNVRRHVRYLREDGILNIVFELDLGVSWHASLIPFLAACGFSPEVLLPFAGQSDLVIFQYHET